LTGRLENLRSD